MKKTSFWKNKKFSLMLVPSGHGKVKTMQLSSRLFWFVGSIALLASLVAVVLTLDYVRILSRVLENKVLRMENLRLRQNLVQMESRVRRIDQTLTKIDFFAKKLKIITNSADPLAAPNFKKNKVLSPKDLLGPEPSSESNTGANKPNNNYDGRNNPGTTPVAYPLLPNQTETGSVVRKVAMLAQNEFNDVMDDLSDQEMDDSSNQEDENFSNFESDLPVEELENDISDIGNIMGKIESESSLIEKNLENLDSTIEKNRAMLAAIPSGRPTRGWLSGRFGFRRSPHTQERAFHNGIDIATNIGVPVRSAADGVVSFADVQSGYGRLVIISHGFGYSTRYGHNSRILVRHGQRVSRGTKIAEVGNTGRSTGPHLHFEVRKNGVPVNPEIFLGMEI